MSHLGKINFKLTPEEVEAAKKKNNRFICFHFFQKQINKKYL